MKALALTAFMLCSILYSGIANAQLDNVADLGNVAATSDELRAAFTCGQTGAPGQPGFVAHKCVQTWFEIDINGFPNPVRERVANAMECNLPADPTQEERLGCALYESGLAASGWRKKNGGGKRFNVGYGVFPLWLFEKIKWCDASCTYADNLRIIGTTWDAMAADANCSDVYGASCGVDGSGQATSDPPEVFGGINPNQGRAEQ